MENACMPQGSEDSEKKPVSVGPFGSSGRGNIWDNIWDDGVHSSVRQLLIHSSFSGIVHIQIQYDDNGNSFWSNVHGRNLPDVVFPLTRTYRVKLDYPGEFLTSVHGSYMRKFWLPTYINSLIFKSNRKTYGPFGGEQGEGIDFSIEVSGSKIVGFHGRADDCLYLRAIGAYLKPLDPHENENLNHPSRAQIFNSSKPALPPGYSADQTKPKKDDKSKKERSYIVSGNQVIGNEGDNNGAFIVGNTYKYKYYYGDKN